MKLISWAVMAMALVLGSAEAGITNVNVQTEAGNVVFYESTYLITFTATPDISVISMSLEGGNSNGLPCPVLRQSREIPANIGAYNWTVATCVAPGSGYYVSVYFPTADSSIIPGNSSTFDIAVPNYPCPAGTANNDTGLMPYCIPCPKGSYSSNTTTCSQCPEGFTTADRGSQNSSLCSVPKVPAENYFIKFNASYFSSSNAGGLNLEDFYGKTPEDCAQLCLNDKGCKAFDSGTPGMFQSEDCFLSYDTDTTIKDGDVRSVPQLMLSVKIDAAPISDVFYKKTSGCYVVGSDAGGSWEDEHSIEACATLCMADPSCVSFDAGAQIRAPGSTTVWQSRIDDCYLSYEVANTSSESWVCDASEGLDYYERFEPSYFVYPTFNYTALFGDNRDAATVLEQSIYGVSRVTTPFSTGATGVGGYAGVLDFVAARYGVIAQLRSRIGGAAILLDMNRNGQLVVAINANNSTRQAQLQSQLNTFLRLIIQGQPYVPTIFQPQTCPAGTVSRTGKSPNCEICPMDTFANRARTNCLPCPVGTISSPGSGNSDEKACRPMPTFSNVASGVFRYGYEWYGYYDGPLGTSYPNRIGSGAISLLVSDANINDQTGAVSVRLLAKFNHGELCVPARGCRDPGVTEIYYVGTVTGNSTTARFTRSTWGGVTDRNVANFNPWPVLNVTIRNVDGNTVLSAPFGPNADDAGTITAIERCYSVQESGTFSRGDQLIGTYGCYRSNDDVGVVQSGVVRVQDVRPLTLEVLDATTDNLTNTISVFAAVSIDHQAGRSTYEVSGNYSKTSGIFRFFPTSEAWERSTSPRPASVPARVISGRLSDDGELLIGSMQPNPACACTGDNYQSQGGRCAVWSDSSRGETPWCYVDSSCPEAAAENSISGYHWAPCANDFEFQQDCPVVNLARTCQVAPALCDVGWTVNRDTNRCYKTTNNQLDFAAAQLQCSAGGGNLVSIHSQDELQFVQDLVDPNSTFWIGMVSGDPDFAWVDGSPVGFTNFQVSQSGDCVTMTEDVGSWSATDCNESAAFVCRKLPLGLASNCTCNGDVDSLQQGGYCNFWDSDAPAWCHVSPNCERAVRSSFDSTLFRATCYDGSGTTTTAPPTVAPPPALNCHNNNPTQYQNGNVCADCTSSCIGTLVLIGECSDYETPICSSCSDGTYYSTSRANCFRCDPRCNTCNGGLASDCLSCASPLALDQNLGACVENCPFTAYLDNDTRTCITCATCPDGQFETGPCSASTQTECAPVSTCSSAEFELSPPTTTSDTFCRTYQDCGVLGVQAEGTRTTDRICNTRSPSIAPTTLAPTNSPSTPGPTQTPTTTEPTRPDPTIAPTSSAPSTGTPTTSVPTTAFPTPAPSRRPTRSPLSSRPTDAPSFTPTNAPSSSLPTVAPTDTCPPGSERKSNGNCQACRFGEWALATPRNINPECTLHSPECESGWEETVEATSSTDRVCTRCPSGYYRNDDMKNSGQLLCNKWKDCNVTTKEGSRTRDRECFVASASTEDEGSSSSLIIIIVIVVVLVLILVAIGGVIYVMKVKKSAQAARDVHSFDNPIYADANPAEDAGGTESAYASVEGAAEPKSGYMDFSEPAYDNVTTMGTGYMDVGGVDEDFDSEEDV